MSPTRMTHAIGRRTCEQELLYGCRLRVRGVLQLAIRLGEAGLEQPEERRRFCLPLLVPLPHLLLQLASGFVLEVASAPAEENKQALFWMGVVSMNSTAICKMGRARSSYRPATPTWCALAATSLAQRMGHLSRMGALHIRRACMWSLAKRKPGRAPTRSLRNTHRPLAEGAGLCHPPRELDRKPNGGERPISIAGLAWWLGMPVHMSL